MAVPGTVVPIGSRISPGGIQGPGGTGPQGEKGDPGTSITILGSYNTLGELQAAHPTGSPGDGYIIQGDLYVWSSSTSSWLNVGTVRGPQGEQGLQGSQGLQGIQGVQGSTGIRGSQWVRGTTTPEQSPQAVDTLVADWYINTATWDVYQKALGDVWVNRGNIKGIQGDQGIKGDKGDEGDPTIPIGAILPFAGAVAPVNYLICDGNYYETSEYPDLFAVIGHTYGMLGTSELTFRVPDLRARVPIGVGPLDDMPSWNYQLGQKFGTIAHTLTISELPNHNHGNVDINHAHNISTVGHNHGDPTHKHNGPTYYANIGSGGAVGWVWLDGQAYYGSTNFLGCGLYAAGGLTGGTDWVSQWTANAHLKPVPAQGGGASHNNVQPSLGVNYIIRT